MLRHSHGYLTLRRQPDTAAILCSTLKPREVILRHSHDYQFLRRQPTATIFFYKHRHFLLPILTAAADTADFLFFTVIHVRFSSDTPTFTNLYGGSHHRPLTPTLFFRLCNNVGFLLRTPTHAVDLQVSHSGVRGRGGPRLLFNLDFFRRHFHLRKTQL